jgi:hypothetical protein
VGLAGADQRHQLLQATNLNGYIGAVPEPETYAMLLAAWAWSALRRAAARRLRHADRRQHHIDDDLFGIVEVLWSAVCGSAPAPSGPKVGIGLRHRPDRKQQVGGIDRRHLPAAIHCSNTSISLRTSGTTRL